jgi:putative transposase
MLTTPYEKIYNILMPNYRRVKIKGGTYFFTLVTYQRQRLFSLPHIRLMFLDAVDYVKKYHPFQLIAYCILPDHVHLICQIPEDDDNYSIRISLIKRRFSKQYISHYGSQPQKNVSYEKRQETGIWQRRFWEHSIRDDEDLNRHFDYVHFNPVKHGLVEKVCDWEHSSFHEFVENGHYGLSWGESYKVDEKKYHFGE